MTAEAHASESTPHAAPGPLRDIVVISDLHLGRGVNPRTKRYHGLETFFYDEDLRGFCAHLCDDAAARGVPFALVLNGDIFDFLRIEPGEPAPDATPVERRFGPLPTPGVAARWVGEILAGHPAFVEALAGVLAAGHEVVFLPGNHDLEVVSEPVQARIREALEAGLAARGAAAAAARLRFEPWFFHEPGRIWIEHGCQYDPENAFRWPLRRRINGAPYAAAIAERDLPLGNFFQKYLYNLFGNVTFIVPSTRANYRYFRWLLVNEPRLLARVARSHGRFLVQLLRRLARAPAPAWLDDAEVAHGAELAELAAGSGLGARLVEIDGLKYVGAEAARAAAGILRQGAKLAAGVTGVSVLALGAWAAAQQAIDAFIVGPGVRALLLVVFYLLFAALAASGIVAAALRVPRDASPKPLRRAAERIAEILDVPIVTFGHTHEEVIFPVTRPGGSGWYFNTGTWIAVFTHDVLVPRDRVQHTFLRVRGTEAELLHWSPGRNRPVPVVLLEEERGAAAAPPRAPPEEREPPSRRKSA